MEEIKKDNQDSGIYYLLAVICGIATAWVIAHSLVWMLVGALLGLIAAGFFVSVILNGKRD